MLIECEMEHNLYLPKLKTNDPTNELNIQKSSTQVPASQHKENYLGRVNNGFVNDKVPIFLLY